MQSIELTLLDIFMAIMSGKNPTYSILRRDGKTLPWDEEGGEYVFRPERRLVTFTSKNRTPPRKFVSITLVLEAVYDLLRNKITITQRELYYMYTFFKTQAESDEAILDVSGMFGIPRCSISISGSAKGCFSGSVFIKPKKEWRDCRLADAEGFLITNEVLNLTSDQIESDAEFILVIEKDGIFRRLTEDSFFNRLPCILVCGKGFPDLATRMFVRKIKTELNIPVRILTDSNPFGLAIALTYMLGSARMPIDSLKYVVDALWIGLLPSQILHLNLPADAKEPFTKYDLRKAETLAKSEFIKRSTFYQTEVSYFLSGQVKVELEALHSLGMGFLGDYLVQVLQN